MTLVLYGRPGCHLCDDARAVLERVGHPFEEVDIEADEVLLARYLERIPVVTLDGLTPRVRSPERSSLFTRIASFCSGWLRSDQYIHDQVRVAIP